MLAGVPRCVYCHTPGVYPHRTCPVCADARNVSRARRSRPARIQLTTPPETMVIAPDPALDRGRR